METAAEQLERAFGYPYPVPETSNFLFDAGEVKSLPLDIDLSERFPVLAVGSNRSPFQLLRKYGESATIPVTRFDMHDHDVAYCAYLTHYGSTPATLVDAPGTCAQLSITWLNRHQLMRMHETESVGPHTSFGQIPVARFECHGCHHDRVFTYVSARGLLKRNGQRVILSEIQASGRNPDRISVSTQREMIHLIWNQHGSGPLRQWLLAIIGDRLLRNKLNETMQRDAIRSVVQRFDPVFQVDQL